MQPQKWIRSRPSRQDTVDSGGVIKEGTVDSGGVVKENTVDGGVVQVGTVDSVGVVKEGTVDGGMVQEGRVNGSGDGRGSSVVEGRADIVRSSTVASITSTGDEHRRQSLGALQAEVGLTLTWQDKDRLRCLLLQNHHAFAVDEGERGETDLIQMSIIY